MKPFRFFALVALLVILSVPAISHAQFAPYFGSIVTCTGNYSGGSSLPPCASICDVLAEIDNLVKLTYTFAIYIIAPLMFIYGGGMIMLSHGNTHWGEDGRKIMPGTAVAVGLVLGSYVIVTTLLGIAGNPANGGVHWPNITCNPQDIPGNFRLDPTLYNLSSTTPSPSASGSSANGYQCSVVENNTVVSKPSSKPDCSDIEGCQEGSCTPASH